MKDKKAVVFTGGRGPEAGEVKNILKRTEMSIAADSGWDLAGRLGVEPDYFIGDMDSVQDHAGIEQLPPERKMVFPVDKDYTDTELAIKFLEERGYRDIVLIGGGGGRIDHLLGIHALFSRETRPAQWFTSREHIIYLDHDATIRCREGQTVSIFGCGSAVSIAGTEGLKWEVEERCFDADFFSLSNIAEKDRFKVSVREGAVLVMLNY